ncbi:MAG: SPOR domain-containing protein [Gammaproteobacteria bacterium]
MDQELKQRLIGAAVVTALAAIFIPMLFDDPIDTSGQAVSEMTIPEPPASLESSTSAKLPTDAASVDNAPGPESQAASASPGSAVNAADIERIDPELQEPPIDYEPPVEVDPALEKQLDQAAEGETVTAPAERPAIPEDEPIESAPTKAGVPSATQPPVRKSQALSETPKAPVKQSPAHVKAPVIPEAAPDSAKPVPKKSTAPAKTGTSFKRYYVQAGSFAKKENALSQVEKLRKQGLPVLLEPLETGKGTIYRLKVGPELSKQRAADIKSRLAQQNIKSIIIAE